MTDCSLPWFLLCPGTGKVLPPDHHYPCKLWTFPTCFHFWTSPVNLICIFILFFCLSVFFFNEIIAHAALSPCPPVAMMWNYICCIAGRTFCHTPQLVATGRPTADPLTRYWIHCLLAYVTPVEFCNSRLQIDFRLLGWLAGLGVPWVKNSAWGDDSKLVLKALEGKSEF